MCLLIVLRVVLAVMIITLYSVVLSCRTGCLITTYTCTWNLSIKDILGPAIFVLVSLLPDLLTSHSTGCIASRAGDAIHPVLWEVSRSGNSETIFVLNREVSASWRLKIHRKCRKVIVLGILTFFIYVTEFVVLSLILSVLYRRFQCS